VGPETARVTTLGTLTPGRRVNLERSMRADSRFGGHLVQGHVDATGTVAAVRPDGDSYWIDVTFPEPLSPMLVPKGSVALNGVSLTVAALEAVRFSVMLIPFTWDHTNLSDLRAGALVNLECDMVGKYVARAAQWYRRP
jgi:riboflavin synthase